MDYSLLFAVERRRETRGSINKLDTEGKRIKVSGGDFVADHVGDLISQVHSYKSENKIYHLAIIDYL